MPAPCTRILPLSQNVHDNSTILLFLPNGTRLPLPPGSCTSAKSVYFSGYSSRSSYFHQDVTRNKPVSATTGVNPIHQLAIVFVELSFPLWLLQCSGWRSPGRSRSFQPHCGILDEIYNYIGCTSVSNARRLHTECIIS